jgi:hypothetical protein
MRHLVILFIHLIAILTQLLQPAGVRSLVVRLEAAFRRFRMDDSYEVAAECAGAQNGKGNLVKYHRFATHVFGKWNSRRCLTHRKRHTSIESLCWRGEVCLDLLE